MGLHHPVPDPESPSGFCNMEISFTLATGIAAMAVA